MLVPRWFYRLRSYLVTPPLIFSFVWFEWEIEVEYLIWPLGIFLILMGLILRIWAQQHLHYRLKVHKRLTVTGPYSFVRNPIYIGNTLICLGATIASELLWLFPVTLFWCLGVYSIVVRYEETHLSEKYGDSYREYLVKVPRWVTRLRNFKNIDVKIIKLRNEFFRDSIFAEIHSLLILLPYIIKEIASP